MSHISEDLYDDGSPVFDPEGKYLYFLGLLLLPQPGQLRLSASITSYTTGIFALTLKADEPAPFGPQSDEEKSADSKDEKEGRRHRAPMRRRPTSTKAGRKKDGESRRPTKKRTVESYKPDGSTVTVINSRAQEGRGQADSDRPGRALGPHFPRTRAAGDLWEE